VLRLVLEPTFNISIKKQKHLQYIFLIALSVIVIGVSFITVVSMKRPKSQPVGKVNRVDTGDGSYVIGTTVPNQMKFVSPCSIAML